VLPASSDVVAWPLVLELGLALAHISGLRVGALDVEHRWPELVPAIDASTPVPPLPIGADLDPFAMSLLTPSLVLLTPKEAVPQGAKVQMLALMLASLSGEASFRHVLVDLTGFEERIGEFLGALDLVDGVITLGRAAITREQDLVRVQRELPDDKNLGVLLVQ
jgi:hypothetical protein